MTLAHKRRTVQTLSRTVRQMLVAGSLSVALVAGSAMSAIAQTFAYQVLPGDTLDGIAQRFGLDRLALVEANSLANPDFILAGQDLYVPGVADVATTSSHGHYLEAPYRSQFDGSAEEDSNCGPATLGMFMSTFGEHWSTGGIRRSVNEQMGIWHPDNGSSWESLAYAARVRDFVVQGLYASEYGYHKWSIDEVLAETNQGRPVMLLVRYWLLPGHENSEWWGDHYILVLGTNANGDIVYHDSAFRDEEGAYRTMGREQLEQAWSRTAVGLQNTAMALQW